MVMLLVWWLAGVTVEGSIWVYIKIRPEYLTVGLIFIQPRLEVSLVMIDVFLAFVCWLGLNLLADQYAS